MNFTIKKAIFQYHPPKKVCSIKIFKPMPIKIIPPAISALRLSTAPKRLPMKTPAKQHTKVTKAIKAAEATIFARIAEKLTPTARASMLVARP